ncbi:MAG TPA: glycosyltransferase, partial [Anaerolineales bacterium]|nr:glycosyltransferase [Anaerolineales bacterium]
MNPTTISNPITSIKDEAFGAKITNATVKTLIVDLSRKFGGASSRVLTLMQNFPSSQASLAVLENSPIAREAQRLGLPFVIVGKYKTSPLIFFRLVSMIRRNGYHVLDTQNPQSKFWGSFAAWVTGIPLVSTLNSWYIDEHGKRSVRGFLYSLLEFGTNFALSRYIVVSQSIFDALVRYGVEPSR